jgi:hypothetical protein
MLDNMRGYECIEGAALVRKCIGKRSALPHVVDCFYAIYVLAVFAIFGDQLLTGCVIYYESVPALSLRRQRAVTRTDLNDARFLRDAS